MHNQKQGQPTKGQEHQQRYTNGLKQYSPVKMIIGLEPNPFVINLVMLLFADSGEHLVNYGHDLREFRIDTNTMLKIELCFFRQFSDQNEVHLYCS